MIKYCSGCKACENICPTGALKIITSGSCFTYEMDKDLCIHCRKCLKVCPMKKGKLYQPMTGLVSFSKNATVVRQSSSGGIATLIYQYGLAHNMNCVGVRFDDKYNLMYSFIDDQKDIGKAKGSKYVYSDMNAIYKKIEYKLRNHETVILIGLPCHISGLKNYCREKCMEIDNLYTVDIACHGVPMPDIFKKHIRNIAKNTNESINIHFREKDNPFGITVRNKNGQIICKRTRYQDEYMYLYLSGHYAEACYQCPYAQKNRCGDITIKDYCYSENGVRIKKDLLHGASHVLINNKKGISLFERISNDGLYIQEVSVDEAVNADSILQRPAPRPGHNHLFHKLENCLGMERAARILYGRHMIAPMDEPPSTSDKYLELFRVMSQWIQAKQEGKNLSSYFIRYGYFRIAIYGISRAGELLINELKETEIKVAYGIDRNAAITHSEIRIVSTVDSWEIVDAVIVTAISSFDEIKEEIAKKLDCPIISLKDILYEVLE